MDQNARALSMWMFRAPAATLNPIVSRIHVYLTPPSSCIKPITVMSI